jgi:hypothetical protein
LARLAGSRHHPRDPATDASLHTYGTVTNGRARGYRVQCHVGCPMPCRAVSSGLSWDPDSISELGVVSAIEPRNEAGSILVPHFVLRSLIEQ